MSRTGFVSALALLASLSALAGEEPVFEISDCPGIEALVAPIQRNSRSFYNGRVVAYNVDVEEPAARSAGLAILVPQPDSEGGFTRCIGVGYFRSIDIQDAKSSYDPKKGLLLEIPYTNYDFEAGDGSTVGGVAKLRIDLRVGTIVAE
jgi:hypothetical protein